MDIEKFIELCGDETDHKQITMKTLYCEAWKSWLDDYKEKESQEPRVLELKRLGLTAEDGFFIWSYTGSSSGWLNSEKRNGKNYSSECQRQFAINLSDALLKIDPYVGTAYRWEEADDKLKKFNWFKQNIGLNVTVPYFLSTSKDDCTADPMIWEIQTMIGGKARDISGISNALCEQEILFLPDAKFRITGVGEDERTIYLQEIDASEEINFELSKVYYFCSNDIDQEMIEPGLFD